MRPALRTLLASIAGNVRRLRTDRGLTQERLAEAADIDLSFLQQIERAEVNLSMAILVAIAEALTVAPAELLQPAEMPAIRRGRPPKKKEAGEGGGGEVAPVKGAGTKRAVKKEGVASMTKRPQSDEGSELHTAAVRGRVGGR